MDDARIKALAEEVLAQVRSATPAPEAAGDLESRVARLEAALRGLQPTPAPRAAAVAVVVAGAHPSQALVAVQGGGGTGQCMMEPDKPCVGSGACRTFGH
jgi:hypothetical protein